MTRERRPHRPALTALVVLVALAGCTPQEAPDASYLEQLAGGVFLPRGAFLHPATLAAERHDPAWTVDHARPILVEDGWGGPEESFAWGVGEETRLRLLLAETGPMDLVLRARAADPERPQGVEILVNDESVRTLTFGGDWDDQRFQLPDGLLVKGENTVVLRYCYAVEPTENDQRPLTLALEGVGLVPRGVEPVWGPGFHVHEERDTLLIDASGTYAVQVDLPEDAEALVFELRAAGHAARDLTLTAGVLTLDGKASTLLNETKPADDVVRLPLAAYRGRPAVLFFTVSDGSGRLVLGAPRLEKKAPQRKKREKDGRAAKPQKKPNIVLIILDAARADHFSTYGYERPTTPTIDALAKESLVFDQAVAECSYTMCSMPSLTTGLSFVDHGLVNHELVLRDEVRTLAEMLAEQGYVTFGLTANPNNSRITGAEQGFEQLFEAWSPHPYKILRRLSRRMENGWQGSLFLMVHLVPPHEPYDPTEEHDLFGDPSYDGPVTSDREQTREIYDGTMTLDDDDLAELVALYDGNLHKGDEAVGRILEMFKRRGLWDDTLVVVTSDHGEAFNEHGAIGHNRTVHEEMVRVPLIVKPPKTWPVAPNVVTDRLVGLSDVVATIYNRLGVEMPAGVEGADLLALDEGYERILPLRSGHPEDPYFGVRTQRFKVFTRYGQLPELFDLVNDPGERHNRFADSRENMLLGAALIARLKHAVERANPLRAGAQEEELTPEDIEMLRTLGYIQ